MTIFEIIMRDAFARLQNATPTRLIPSAASGVQNIRRTHLLAVSRENAPAVHHVDGDDERRAETDNRGCTSRRCFWRVAIFVRAPGDDNVYALADPIVEEVLRRLDPAIVPYSYGDESARVTLTDVHRETEIADGDAQRVDLRFQASYETQGFTLSPAP